MIERLHIPVVKPNEAMFHAAIELGQRVGMLATFAPAVSTMADEFNDYVAHSPRPATLTTVVVPDAIDRLRRGDVEAHNRLVSAHAQALSECDSIMLAHFSTSRAAAAVRAVVGVPVLAAPHAAVDRMRAMIEATAGRDR